KGDLIFQAIKQQQTTVVSKQMPTAILDAQTGISALDEALNTLKTTGYMHNHMRMYVASIVCNIAKTDWKVGADWMYSQLLDGDLASNHLSWQWVAGTNSNKKYYANQNNINTYFGTNDRGTFLDKTYEELPEMEIPDVLQARREYSIQTDLNAIKSDEIHTYTNSLIHTYYNIDLEVIKTTTAQHILLLEPKLFRAHPVTNNCLEFVINLAKNIQGIKIFVGEFDNLLTLLGEENIIYKEHPTNQHFKGKKMERDWMTTVKGDFPSFFKFWNKAKKELQYD
ncbi:FAD-binding domain-containing protein, partial [Lishizhenia sp.]|uniref:FAD-binding domain-containing protein n=1 Tax=Lishizhenia sp. TaxID=2497594 RepID=UPI00299D16A5